MGEPGGRGARDAGRGGGEEALAQGGDDDGAGGGGQHDGQDGHQQHGVGAGDVHVGVLQVLHGRRRRRGRSHGVASGVKGERSQRGLHVGLGQPGERDKQSLLPVESFLCEQQKPRGDGAEH